MPPKLLTSARAIFVNSYSILYRDFYIIVNYHAPFERKRDNL